ncbi:MAG: hypothetical protein AVDCRST_MAG56-3616 [uncultured Cytophagales bacterium]|uniref:Uncharacterized protein n=1 Tax=uncultured Cytophagales bacterium TaxID=158755 RepID=A0A6J4JHK9_9SPHI|nr:MAG: hypothetical protein AVDCRST_MAG56-3616 [uncultured Cytophagales bacterium]
MLLDLYCEPLSGRLFIAFHHEVPGDDGRTEESREIHKKFP